MSKKYTTEELQEINRNFEELLDESEFHYVTVDKQIAVRRIIMNAFKKEGIDPDCIHEAGDAYSAIAKATSPECIYVFFSEVVLPDTDIVKFIQRLRKKRPQRKDVFILVTSDAKNKLIAAAVQEGVVAVLEKPTNPEAIMKKVKELKLM